MCRNCAPRLSEARRGGDGVRVQDSSTPVTDSRRRAGEVHFLLLFLSSRFSFQPTSSPRSSRLLLLSLSSAGPLLVMRGYQGDQSLPGRTFKTVFFTFKPNVLVFFVKFLLLKYYFCPIFNVPLQCFLKTQASRFKTTNSQIYLNWLHLYDQIASDPLQGLVPDTFQKGDLNPSCRRLKILKRLALTHAMAPYGPTSKQSKFDVATSVS